MKIYCYIIALLLSISMCSCEKYLSVDSANIRSVATVEDLRGMLGGYLLSVKNPLNNMNGMPKPTWYEMAFFPNGEVIRMFYYYDNGIETLDYLSKNAGTRQLVPFLQGMDWSMKSVHKHIWDNAYLSIGFMNHIITESGNVTGDEEVKKQIVGEAKIIRCWHAFKLLQYFAPYKDNELGIPLNFDSETVHVTSGVRLKQSEVYRIIIQELEEVLSYTTPSNNEYNIFYRKALIHGLLAQIHLYKSDGPVKESNDWSKARSYATQSLSAMSLETTPKEMNTLFKSDQVAYYGSNPHALAVFFWKGKSVSLNDIIMQWGYPGTWEAQNKPADMGIIMKDELLNMYSETDIRMQDNVYVYNRKHMEIGKYIQVNYTVRDIFTMFRAAEMHLIVAESYIKEGDAENAKKWLNDFKAARKAGTWTSTDVLQEILNERRKEFVAEFDYRWLDMKRYQISATHQYNHPQLGAQTVQLNGDDYRYNFFIPQDSELASNKNLEQNPGWETGN